MRLLLVPALLAVLAVPVVAADYGKPDAKADEGITKTAYAFFDAWNRHEPKTMATYWAEDAVLINPMGRVAHGRAEIEKLLSDEQTTVFKGSTANVVSMMVTRRLGPELAFCDGEITVDGAQAPDGSALPQMRIHLAQLMERVRGRWLVAEARPYAFMPSRPPAGSSQ